MRGLEDEVAPVQPDLARVLRGGVADQERPVARHCQSPPPPPVPGCWAGRSTRVLVLSLNRSGRTASIGFEPEPGSVMPVIIRSLSPSPSKSPQADSRNEAGEFRWSWWYPTEVRCRGVLSDSGPGLAAHTRTTWRPPGRRHRSPSKLHGKPVVEMIEVTDGEFVRGATSRFPVFIATVCGPELVPRARDPSARLHSNRPT